jgi:hypothetical protein
VSNDSAYNKRIDQVTKQVFAPVEGPDQGYSGPVLQSPSLEELEQQEATDDEPLPEQELVTRTRRS